MSRKSKPSNKIKEIHQKKLCRVKKKNDSQIGKPKKKRIWSPHRYQKVKSLCFMSGVDNQTKNSRRQFWL